MKKPAFAFFTAVAMAGCASVSTVATSKLNNINGSPVSEATAANYADLPSFIKANIDNTSTWDQRLKPEYKAASYSQWKAFVFDAASDMRRAKKPRADLELFCKVKGGEFGLSVRETKSFRVPEPTSPLMAGIMGASLARSRGDSEMIAQQTFMNAYQEQWKRNNSSYSTTTNEAVLIANRMVAEGLVGLFSCKNQVPGKSWDAGIDLAGFQPKSKSNTLDSHTMFMTIYAIPQ